MSVGQQLSGHPTASSMSGQPQGTSLALHESATLGEIIKVINKVSQNLHAEMLLREVAAVRRGTGTLAEGLKEGEAFLSEAGVTQAGTGFVLADGSGLARQDLTTPDSTVAVLRYMWQRPERGARHMSQTSTVSGDPATNTEINAASPDTLNANAFIGGASGSNVTVTRLTLNSAGLAHSRKSERAFWEFWDGKF